MPNGTITKSSNQPNPSGGKFADIKQRPIPEAGAFREKDLEEPAQSKAE